MIHSATEQLLKLRLGRALAIIKDYGGTDGAHHKQWVLDQVVQALTDLEYEAWVKEFEAGEDGPHTYEWDKGIAP